MTGERDLGRLLSGMEPALDPRDWGYALAPPGTPAPWAWAQVAEDEGLTLIAPLDQLDGRGWPVQGPFARITLTIHSSLDAVGLTAAVSTALARAGISANVVAGWHHDHIFLPTARAAEALDILRRLATSA